eukprot:TRINITY_DN48626_c0_g1_i1.p1 TRINITY_DN48626_c0_g1~~TRINITY_DN48626_c0_g1_i1.p1  ORF type:complete len:646 (+),score=115.77 TRINITY_DN48626_c0_g1_i1:81-2018(+)
MMIPIRKQGAWQLAVFCSATLVLGVIVARARKLCRRAQKGIQHQAQNVTRILKKWKKLAVLISDTFPVEPFVASGSPKGRCSSTLGTLEAEQHQRQLVTFFGDLEHGRARYRCMVLTETGLLCAAPLSAGRVLQVDPVSEVAREIGPEIGGLNKYLCLSKASSGLLIAAPFNAGHVLRIDPIAETVHEIGPPLHGLAKYACTVGSAGGLLYAAPLNAHRVLQINPVTNAVREIGPEMQGLKKYYCMAAAADGLLYAAPFNAGRVLLLDPKNEEVTEIGPRIAGMKKYYSMAPAPNGFLYAAPFDAERVLQINPTTHEVKEIGPKIPGSKKYHCITAAANGMLYAAPFNASRVLRIDPSNGDVQEIGAELRGTEKYGCLAAAPCGSLCAAPWSAGRALRVDPNTDEVETIGPEMQGLEKYACIVATANGSFCAVPCQARRVLQVGLHCGGSAAQDHCQPACLNNALLLELGMYSDVTVLVGTQSFAAHRAILARFPFFRAAFEQPFVEKCRTQIDVKNTSEEAFEQVLQVMYTGQMPALHCTTDVSLLQQVLELAERFDLSHLKVLLAQRIEEVLTRSKVLNPETVGLHLAFARLYMLPSVLRLCLDYTKQHAAEVMMAAASHDLFERDPETFKELVLASTSHARA